MIYKEISWNRKIMRKFFIDGTVFTLGGTEDEAYLRQVAAYLNEKIGEVRKLDGFSRQSPEYQNLTIQLNLSDDYFKEQMRANDLEHQKEELEKDAYSLKHELITTQMKFETQSRELEVAKAAPSKTGKSWKQRRRSWRRHLRKSNP